MKQKCCIPDCKEEHTYDVPNFLCDKHWQMWFDYKIKVRSRFTGRIS